MLIIEEACCQHNSSSHTALYAIVNGLQNNHALLLQITYLRQCKCSVSLLDSTHPAKMLSETIFRANFKEGGIQCEFIFKMSPENGCSMEEKSFVALMSALTLANDDAT